MLGMPGQVVLGAFGLQERRPQYIRIFGVVVIIVIIIVVVEVVAAENRGMQSLPAPRPGLARTRSRAGSIVVAEKRRAQMRRSAGWGTPDRLVVIVFIAEKRRAKLAFALVGFGTSGGVIEVVQVIVLGTQKRRSQTATLRGFSISLGSLSNILEIVFFVWAAQHGRVKFDLCLLRFACRTRGSRLGRGYWLPRNWSGCRLRTWSRDRTRSSSGARSSHSRRTAGGGRTGLLGARSLS